MEKPTKPQTSSSARADADQPAEVVIEFEPMVSKDPIIWNKRRYDYVFKVAHTNSGKGGWHIYCCDAQIPWVQDAKAQGLLLTKATTSLTITTNAWSSVVSFVVHIAAARSCTRASSRTSCPLKSTST